MELKNLDLPQLIVALDSLNDDANYVHIKDVREDVTYYCPCCKGIVKPRAYKKDQEYQVQAHFYHETGGCNEETYVHYICKNWLFEKGCKFIVTGVEYEVDNTKTEETLHTSFGDYRPDIIVTTTIGKVFYFEIRTTNKKTELYAPKWDELGNDVVEVDTRYFINQKHKNDIPEFELIYSNGECFIKSYSRNDYEETIAKRKLEWKRQDKLNYKMQWEKLDWFWCELQKYKNMKCSEQDVISSYSELSFEDMVFCWKVIHNHKLRNIYKECLCICNAKFEQELLNENIVFRQIKTYVYEYSIKSNRYFSGSCTYITYRRKIKDVELYNKIINDLYLDKRKLIQGKLLELNMDVLNDIKEICVRSDLYHIEFKSDKHYEHGVRVNYDDSLSDDIAKYYQQRKLKRYKEYKQHKKKILLSSYEVDKSKQVTYKRKKYTHDINDICSIINNCKNMQWYCTWSWCKNLNIKIELYFEYEKNVKTYSPYYDYNYSLTFIIEEKKFRQLKDIITKYMIKLYKMSGLVSLRGVNYEFSYHRFGQPNYRKLLIDSEVNNE